MKNLQLLLIILLLSSILISKEDSNKLQVIGGEEASIEEVPWQAALYSTFGNEFDFGCGAVIIEDRWLLTAAHCVDYLFDPEFPNPNESMFIKLGIDDNSEQETDFLEIEMIVFNNDYGKFTDYRGDIALIKLKQALDLSSDKIEIVELLTPEQEQAGLNAPGTMALTSGWGSNDTISYEAGAQLMKVEIPIVHLDTAKLWFSQRYPGFENLLYDDQIPAGFTEGGKSSCFGDSGGPLVVRNEDDTKWLLTGIVSWGPQCAGEQTPGVYSRVPYHYNWIKETIERSTPNFEKEIDLRPVAINFGIITGSCEGPEPRDFYLNFLNSGTSAITSFEYRLSVASNDDASLALKSVDLQEELASGDIYSFWDDIELELETGDATIEVIVTSVNGVQLQSPIKLVENTKIVKPIVFEIDYNLKNTTNTPQVAYKSFFENDFTVIELNEQEGPVSLYECMEEDFYQFIINIPESEGEVKIYMYDVSTEERVLVYNWNDGMSSQVLAESFNMSLPYNKYTELGLLNYNQVSYCDIKTGNEEVYIEVANNSSFFIEDLVAIVSLDGQEINRYESNGLNPDDIFEIYETINFDGEPTSLSVELSSEKTDISGSVTGLSREFQYNFGTGEVHNVTFSPSLLENSNLSISLWNNSDGNEMLFYSMNGNDSELCITSGCYSGYINNTFSGNAEALSGDIVFTNSNGDETARLVIDDYNILPQTFREIDLCFDTVKGISIQNYSDDLEIVDNTIQFESEIIKNFFIYDINGNRIDLKQSNSSSIDLNSLNTGVYFFYIETSNGIYRDKFLKY